MSYDIVLFKKDKSKISKRKLEGILWKQYWIARSTEKDTYEFMHNKDQSYIEIKHDYYETVEPLIKTKKVDSIELRTWASSSEWTINHLIRLSFLLSEKLGLIVYDPQLGEEITVKDIDKLEETYFKWRLSVKAFELKLDIDPKKLIPITVFVAHSFLSCDDLINDYIISLLRHRVKEVLTGRPYQTVSMSKKIKDKIKRSDLVVAILTKRERITKGKYKTSEWVKDEATFAAGAQKDVIFIKENEVVDIPGIFGDYEWIPLDRNLIGIIGKEIDKYLRKYKKGRRLTQSLSQVLTHFRQNAIRALRKLWERYLK